MSVPVATLANGVTLPMLGLGMDQGRDERRTYEAVGAAIEAGYRSFDTATYYGTEAVLGRALRDAPVPREELFVSTKVRQEDQGFDATLRAFETSLRTLGMTYLDSYLIHWPGRYLFVDTWRALERLYREKRVRAIGVCNFLPRHLARLCDETDVVPMVDQVEWHPYFQQPDVAAFCEPRHILVEAWSPLMFGGAALSDPVVRGIAARTGRSPAQVVLRWHVQGGRRVFPKSANPIRIRENISIFDFELSSQEMADMDALRRHNVRIGPDPEVFFSV